jgi:flavin reductase (DIM6/NTAB) family NADH-FMN oxidoreductase RutF
MLEMEELNMSQFYEITPEKFQCNPFTMIGKQWMLVTAEKDGKVNTMTASWGGLGIMWNKNVAFIVIRPQRYTKEFIDHADTFSLSFYNESFRKELAYLGKVSGRDEDKIKNVGLTIRHHEATPYFEEANTVIICKKLFNQPFDKSAFLDMDIPPHMYPDDDYHTLYIADIKTILQK